MNVTHAAGVYFANFTSSRVIKLDTVSIKNAGEIAQTFFLTGSKHHKKRGDKAILLAAPQHLAEKAKKQFLS